LNFSAAAIPAPVVHSVSLTWNSSTSPNVSGYNVYRGTAAGGPYAKLTASPIIATSYIDNSVASGRIYFYVASTVSGSMESAYSTEVKAIVPTP
jgi:fibronectin type 3 domain-containing protein